jgi:hypothetical protein
VPAGLSLLSALTGARRLAGEVLVAPAKREPHSPNGG